MMTSGLLDEQIVVACVQLVVVALFKEGVGNHGSIGDGVKGFETTLGIVIAIDDGCGLAGYQLRICMSIRKIRIFIIHVVEFRAI